MSRTVPEWQGRTDDSAIPDRVKDRIADKSKRCCVTCRRPVGGKLRPEFDHVIPLILGGAHRESNLQLLCNECHAAKTKLDVKLKAKVARIRKRNLGIRKSTRRIQSRGFAKPDPQRSATRGLRRTTTAPGDQRFPMTSSIQKAFRGCSSVERDRLTAAEICIDECLTILDRHGTVANDPVYLCLMNISRRLHEAHTNVDGLIARRKRLLRVRAMLTDAFPMTDDDLAEHST